MRLIMTSLLLMGCAGGAGSGSGDSSGATTTATSLQRTFTAGPASTQYTASVALPSSTGATITVGAIGGQTAFQYFNTNIASAISAGASKVLFPTGNYTITPEGGAIYHLVVNAATDLVIDGQGSSLIFAGASPGSGATAGTISGVIISGSRRVVFQNFVMDYDVRIASSGTVQSESAHCSGVTHKYVAVNTGTYPMTDTRLHQAKMFNDSTSTLWGIRANEYYTYTSPIAYNVGSSAFFPCSSAFDTAFPTNGNTVTVRHFAYDAPAIALYGANEDITLSNLTLYSSPSMGIFVSKLIRGLAIQNFQAIKNPADSSRLITFAADGIHLDQVGGDIIIENSQVSYQGDDGLNIVSKITNGTTVSGSSMTLSTSDYSGFGNMAVGDVFKFFNASFTPIGSATVQSLAPNTNIVFDSLSGISTGSWAYDQSMNTARVYIANNNFHHNRERGLIARSTGLYISNNQFVQNSGPAILLFTDGLDFKEGGFAKDVSILNNTVTSANKTQTTSFTNKLEYGAIAIGVQCPTGSGCTNTLSPASSLIQNIAILNNTVNATAGIGILLSNITNGTVSGNTITDSASTVQQTAFGGTASAAGSIHTTRSSALSIGTNTVSRAATSN